MLEDLRDTEADLFDESEAPEEGEAEAALPEPRDSWGMTPVQRFVLAVMFLMMICLLGSMCLLVTERVWLPWM